MLGLLVRNANNQLIVRPESHIACFYKLFTGAMGVVGTSVVLSVPRFNPNMRGHYACLELPDGIAGTYHTPFYYRMQPAIGQITLTLIANPDGTYAHPYSLRVWL